MTSRKDLKLYLSLILWSLIPSIYLLVRMNIVSLNSVDLNILGQMEWFDLIDEIIATTLLVPLYSLLKKDDTNRNGTALIISFVIYFLFALLVALRISTITRIMNAENATKYLLLQTLALLFDFINKFSIILFTIRSKHKLINTLVIIKIFFLIICDYIFIKTYKDIGAAYSEILVNAIIAVTSIVILKIDNSVTFNKIDFSLAKEWIRVGTFCGIQIFLDNFIYALMIVRMVNVVKEAGNYWVANNFIWGWLLVPVLCFAEIIKKNDLKKLGFNEVWKYGLFISALWILSMPFWKVFIDKAMAVDANNILPIVFPNIPFYLTYIISAFIDAWFVSKGKTIYLMLISLIVNIAYYGIIFILFKHNYFNVNMNFIIYMFGGGMIVHMLLSILFYNLELRSPYGTHQ
jgi:hypothetical protein